jgi:hypothetical protein
MQGSETNTEEAKMKPVNTIAFNREDDGDLIQLINRFAQAYNDHVTKKTPPRNAIRNFLSDELPKAIARLTGDNGNSGDNLAEQS